MESYASGTIEEAISSNCLQITIINSGKNIRSNYSRAMKSGQSSKFWRRVESWKKRLLQGEFPVYLQLFPECRPKSEEGTEQQKLQWKVSYLSDLNNKFGANKGSQNVREESQKGKS